MAAFDSFMDKIDFLVKIMPLRPYSPLSKIGEKALRRTAKPYTVEMARADIFKLGIEEIERRYEQEMKKQVEALALAEAKIFFHQSSCDADFYYWGKQAYCSIGSRGKKMSSHNSVYFNNNLRSISFTY